MQRNNISLEVMHKQLDINNDGVVDKQEFVEGIYSLMRPCPITNKDLGEIFDQIDVNGDHYLSVNEFALFLEGAKMTNKQKNTQAKGKKQAGCLHCVLFAMH